ncbi:MAG: FG-GAP repeat domain-containing protein, partial [Desulfobulbia bacterium]
IIIMIACQSDKPEKRSRTEAPLFTSLTASSTGLDFFNFIRENHELNIFTYDYLYNGAGLAIGDVNNDGLPDIYFTGNMGDNKLYINQGNLKFKDVTLSAGVAGTASWCNGVTMCDINNDGFQDIYVCRSFHPGNLDLRRNLLYVNNKNGTFSEQAKAYGIDDIGHSVQSTFFDYDNDGDLDLFLANHPNSFKLPSTERYAYWQSPPPDESNKLYRNNGNNSFTDVTKQAGLLDYAFSLGVIAQDFNTDGHTDIFVSNDYDEPDHYFVNNGDGTFSNEVEKSFKHLSNFGMGVDAGDINNDGHTDLITVDMLAEDNYREKTQMGSMAPEAFWIAVDWGYHYQYMRNSLHLNNGNGSFSEIGQMAGVHRTDWSWAPLLADFDNDGNKDLFITNGFRRDSRNKDIRTKNDRILNESAGNMSSKEIMDLLEAIPSTKVNNYLYQNNGDYTFNNVSKEAGIAIPSFSNGAAYADFDL